MIQRWNVDTFVNDVSLMFPPTPTDPSQCDLAVLGLKRSCFSLLQRRANKDIYTRFNTSL